MKRRFWVFIEQEDGRVHPVAWELLTVACRLADEVDDHAVVEGVLVGNEIEHIAREAISYGAETVFTVDDPVFRNYLNRPYATALTTLVRKYEPEVFLIGATTLGRDLAGAVATSLGTGLTADTTHLAMGDVKDSPSKLLLATRPAFGGNVIATIVCRNHSPQMATVRPRVFTSAPPRADARGDIVHETIPVSPNMINAEILEFITNKEASVKLEYGEVIVAGGRGLGGPKGFDLLKELADELGGILGSSRACVDAGWIKYDHQVGQTGKTVRPKLYIAAGISGAIQHKVGMQESDFILAINRNPQAPIFEIATTGIVGDLYEVIPALIKQIRSLKELRHA
jgi:electron transfer flavoprotein alpha subunit